METLEVIQVEPRWIELKNIESSPGPYCMSFGFDIASLIRSIRKVGLVNSPLLIGNENEHYTVISGYRRIHALRSLGWEKTPARSLPQSQQSPLKSLLVNLYDNLATRQLNQVEKGMVLSRLIHLVPVTEIVEYYMPLLNLPAHEPTLRFYIALENELENPIKEFLVQGNLSLQAASKLLDLEKEAKTEVFKLISKLKFNVNEQNQVIEYIIDISNTEKKSIPEILKQLSLERIVSDPRKNNPQKAKAILKFLRTQRFPRLAQAEAVFKKRTSRLRLPEGVRIAAPLYFESPDYQLQVTFKDGMDLKAKIDRLSETEGLKSLANPWGQQGA